MHKTDFQKPKDDDSPECKITKTSGKPTVSGRGKTAVVQKRKIHPKIKGLKIKSPEFLPTKALISPSTLYLYTTNAVLMRNARIVPCLTASVSRERTGFAV
jgi:hypothetical protein